MHLQDRWKRIIDELSSERVTSVDELTERLGVSPATIRRDLNELHELGHLLRVRGGAMRSEGKLYSGREEKRSEGLRGQSSFSDSVIANASAKRAARKAAPPADRSIGSLKAAGKKASASKPKGRKGRR